MCVCVCVCVCITSSLPTNLLTDTQLHTLTIVNAVTTNIGVYVFFRISVLFFQTYTQVWNCWFIGHFYFPNYFLQIATQRLKENTEECHRGCPCEGSFGFPASQASQVMH